MEKVALPVTTALLPDPVTIIDLCSGFGFLAMYILSRTSHCLFSFPNLGWTLRGRVQRSHLDPLTLSVTSSILDDRICDQGRGLLWIYTTQY